MNHVMIRNIVFISIIITLVSCHCSNIDCETGPPELFVRVLDKDGTNPLATNSLVLGDIQIRDLNKSTPTFSTYFDGILSFSLANTSASYELSIKKIPSDTFDIKIIVSEGECCSSFTISEVTNNGIPTMFRPFMNVNL
jgi:hypothetical protein